MAVISNCSPLRYFIVIGRADLLYSVFGTITIPAAVFKELTHPSAPPCVRDWMAHSPEWLHIEQSIEVSTGTLADILDAGEAAAIQLALSTNASAILIDERRGRKEAQLRGLKTIGGLAVLIEAHRRRLISDPEAILNELRRSGFRVSQRLIDRFRQQIAT